MSRSRYLIVAVCVAVLLAGCAAGANTVAGQPPADGFWQGLWHGIISPVTFVVSLFNDRVSMYEVHNSGGWYDLGFLLGIGLPASTFGTAGSRARAGNRD